MGYAIQIVLALVLLFLFSQSFFFVVSLVLIIFPWIFKTLMERQSKNIHVQMQVSSHVTCGEKILLKIHIEGNQKLRFVKGISCPIEIRNYLYGRTVTKTYFLEFSDYANDFETYIDAPVCGKMEFSLHQIRFLDLMSLFECQKNIRQIVQTTVYPTNRQVDVVFSNEFHGLEDISSGQLNQKGHDLNESYGIRQYVDGDDVRSIHWKLSSKMDSWMIRESAEPFHDEVILLSDLSMFDVNGKVQEEEINCAIGISYAIGKELLKKNLSFCFVIASRFDIVMNEIHTQVELIQALNNRLTMPLADSLNKGLQYFMSEHMETNYSHLIVINVGETDADTVTLNGSIETCFLSVDQNVTHTNSTKSGSITMMQVSTNAEEHIHVMC